MSKYDRLGAYLSVRNASHIPMTFKEIEQIVGTKLPKSQEYPAWWSNSTSNNVMTKVWLDAGYQTEQVDVARKRLVFRRNRKNVPPTQSGMQDSHQPFRHGSDTMNKNECGLIGAMKGTFTIEPGYDLTKPALDADEMAQWDASLDAKADLLNSRLRKA